MRLDISSRLGVADWCDTEADRQMDRQNRPARSNDLRWK